MNASEERFDVLTRDGIPTGRSKARHDVHRDGDWHAAVHVWVFLEDGSLLLQRRSMTKDLAAGKVDVSVGGHLQAGETWLDALREVEEEIGVGVRAEDVTMLGTHATQRIYATTIDREVQTVLAARMDASLQDLRMDSAEVASLYAAPWPDALQLWRSGTPLAVQAIHGEGAGPNVIHEVMLREDDLIREAFPGILTELAWLEAWCATQR